MPEPDRATEVFLEHRNLLFTIAYELLGSVCDAEDVVQETWLRWVQVALEEVREPKAYLARIVTRQGLNRLRTLKRRRETYVGTWLPEPLLTTPDVAEDVELADAVSFAMLIVLETLSPRERAAFVLREVFGFDYVEIAEAIGASPASVRQLVSRARRHVEARRPRLQPPTDHDQLARLFQAAVQSADLQPLMDLLAPGVVLMSDGGGRVQAALRPIVGPDKVARFLTAVAPDTGRVELRWTTANGYPGLVLLVDGLVDTVAGVGLRDGMVAEIYLVRNPEKLGRVDQDFVASRG